MIIECPAEFGETVYHLQELRYRKNSLCKEPKYTIVKCIVDSIHIGRTLKKSGNTYIRLRSVNTGYIHTGISFEEFEKNCFRSYADAVKVMKERGAE
ncbi:MAG: hypothetical protein IJ723_01930 [Ruminococcus sp.]|nr:hypothetical protein [Ruminococcus sp.]